MKKTLIVLLVAVLALGSVFASVTMTGYANIDFGYDLESTEWGFKNGTFGATDFTFTLASDKASFGSVGEGNVYGEIEASFKVTLSSGASPSYTWVDTGSSWVKIPNSNLTSGTTNSYAGTWSATITKANIIAGEWTFGILNAGGGKDYAKTYYYVSDSSSHKYVQVSKVKMNSKSEKGFTVSYSDLFNGGFGASGTTNADKYNIFAHGEYTGIENLGIYGWTYLKDSAKVLGAGAKYSYKEDKIDAFFGTDFKYTFDGAAEVEVQANATVANIAAYAYFLTQDTFSTNKLDAKVVASIEDSIVADVYVEGRDIIDGPQDITVGADFNEGIVITEAWAETVINNSISAGLSGKIEDFSFSASYSTNYDFNDHIIKGSLKYSCDSFEASIGTGSKGIEFTDTLVHAAVKASIASTSIIDNCKISLTYEDADFAKNPSDEIINLGKVTASAKISF